MLRRAAGRVCQLALASARHQDASSRLLSATTAQLVHRTTVERPFATNSHDIFNVHHHSADNNWETPFDFTDTNYELVSEIISRYPENYKASAVIPVLDVAQKQNKGFLTLSALNRVAKVLDMPEIRVYEVATFYTMFNRSKIGSYHIMICGTTPCRLQGAEEIYHTLHDHLGIGYGETTKDGLFTLGEMECMGSCVNAPMLVVADYSNGVEGFSYNYYEDLTPEDAINLVEQFKAGKIPQKVGSQHRDKAEPVGAIQNGKWVPGPEGTVQTLVGQPRGPYCRNLDDALPPEAPKEAPKQAAKA